MDMEEIIDDLQEIRMNCLESNEIEHNSALLRAILALEEGELMKENLRAIYQRLEETTRELEECKEKLSEKEA